MQDALIEIMREAGALALSFFGTPLKTWVKDFNSPVTEADIAVDLLLRDRLSKLAPDAAWLSEESVDDLARLAAPRLWIVDPIDGTRAYMSGKTDWTIVAALVEGGRPILASVFAPVANQMFIARKGKGTSVNGRSVSVSGGDDVESARVAGPNPQLDRLAKIFPRMEKADKVHSLALRLARVADGTLDAAFASSASRDWDLAAADLLVHEAGGALTNLAGDGLQYNRVDTAHGALLAAGLSRHRALLDALVMKRAPSA